MLKNSNFHREVFLFFHEVFLTKIIVIIIIMKQMDYLAPTVTSPAARPESAGFLDLL